jgi:hypothetical protein
MPQPEQLADEQPLQEEPADELTVWPPSVLLTNPQAERSFCTSFVPHLGHWASSPLRIRVSNFLSHSWQ